MLTHTTVEGRIMESRQRVGIFLAQLNALHKELHIPCNRESPTVLRRIQDRLEQERVDLAMDFGDLGDWNA